MHEDFRVASGAELVPALLELASQVRLALSDVDAFDDFAVRRAEAAAEFHLKGCPTGPYFRLRLSGRGLVGPRLRPAGDGDHALVSLADADAPELRAFRITGPDIEEVELTIVRDAGVRVEESVEDVQKSLIEGATLTVLVVFFFLASWRSTGETRNR